MLGAKRVTGVEIDERAVRTAQENAASVGMRVEFFTGDVHEPSLKTRIGTCDTVIMNPPFGAQQVHADRPFIDLALSIAPVTYGIFNAGSRQFIETYEPERAGGQACEHGVTLFKSKHPNFTEKIFPA